YPIGRRGVRPLHRARRTSVFRGLPAGTSRRHSPHSLGAPRPPGRRPSEPAEGIRLIHSVGGLAAWAHPNELDGKDWRAYLPAVVGAGIDGLEVYYSKEYGPEVAAQMHQACQTYDLVPTVGSDFHGFGTLAAPP